MEIAEGGTPTFVTLAVMVDDLWLGRAGIAAELVSFVLLAPQILGRARLQDWERSIEGWAGRQRVFKISPSLELTVMALAGAVGAILAVVIRPSWTVFVPASVALVLVVVYVLSTDLVIRGMERFLDPRRERLRTSVTIAGFALLFVGLTMQFIATF